MTVVATKALDTAPGQLADSRLQEPEPLAGVTAFSSDNLAIPRRIFKALWREGIIDNTSYAALAMYFDGVGGDSGFTEFDMNGFAVRWSEHWQVDKVVKGKKGGPDTIKVIDNEKQLTETQIETALGKFEKKEKAVVKRDIQLNIDWRSL